MWDVAAVWAVQLERATEPLIGVPWRWFSAPQLRCAVVVFLDDTRSITAIDGNGGQVEQGAIVPMIVAPKEEIARIANASDDTLTACLTRISVRMTTQQRMTAQQICRIEETTRQLVPLVEKEGN